MIKFEYKKITLILTILLIHSIAQPLKSSFYTSCPETEESKSQKIRKEIEKRYSIDWDKEQKQRIHKQTLQFFENCPNLLTGAVEYSLKAFSTCSPQEAQELIAITQSLSKDTQDKNSYYQAVLLKDIADIDPQHRPLFTKQLERFAQRELSGDFYKISEKLGSLKPDQYVYMTDLTLQFFENCSELWTGGVEYSLKAFSKCSAQEAQELITMTQSLAKVAGNEDSLHQAFLLEYVSNVDPKHRPLFIKQLERFTQKELSEYFYKIAAQLEKCKPEQYVSMTDLILQFYENFSSIPGHVIEYPFAAFSKCSSLKEAQELIAATQSLSKMAQNEKAFQQTLLLRDIAGIDPQHRPLFIKQLERFTQRKLSSDFYEISSNLQKLKFDQYVRVTDLTLQFFENCSKLSANSVEYPFKVFSACSAQEAQELITMTQSLSKAAQNEGSLHQAFLLERIARVGSVKRAAAYSTLIKVAHRFEERSFFSLDSFYQLYDDFVKLDPARYEGMADLIIRFGASDRDINKLSINKGQEIIQAFKNISPETQPLFLPFLEVNQVINFEWAKQLAQVPPRDWADTLRGLQNQRVLRHERDQDHQPVIKVNNQTAHDTQVVEDIATALTKLRQRYGRKPLQNVVSLFETKIKGALDQQFLLEDESEIALLCLAKLESDSKMRKHLSLIYQALEEKSLNLSEQELAERWASWTRSALVDSQLAYWNDLGMEGIPPRDQWFKFESCFGGSANRLIFALNLIHPDVVIKEGQEILENMERYKEERAYGRLSIYGQHQLSKDLNTYQADHPAASKEEIESYLQGQFQKAIGETNQQYLKRPKFQELMKSYRDLVDLF